MCYFQISKLQKFSVRKCHRAQTRMNGHSICELCGNVALEKTQKIESRGHKSQYFVLVGSPHSSIVESFSVLCIVVTHAVRHPMACTTRHFILNKVLTDEGK